MAVTPVHAVVTVTTAGTRVQVNSDAKLGPSSIYFEASGGNGASDYIYVGLVTVTNAIYIARLAAGAGFGITADVLHAGLQLSSFYIDATTNGNKCQVTYL